MKTFIIVCTFMNRQYISGIMHFVILRYATLLVLLLEVILAIPVTGQGVRAPNTGDMQIYAREYRTLTSNFYEKTQAGTYNLSFIKPVYSCTIPYKSTRDIRYNGSIISADLSMETPDGQKYYYIRKGNNLYTSAALINSEMTKSGLMMVIYSPAIPTVFLDNKSELGKYKATVIVKSQDLSPKYDWLSSKGDYVQLEIVYALNSSTTENAQLQLGGTTHTTTRQENKYYLESSCQILNGKSKSEYKLNPYLWPGKFRQEVVWGNYDEIKFYNDKYADAILQYKVNSREVADIYCQSMSDAISLNKDDMQVISYPNPSYGDIYFDLVNYPKDKYVVEVYNAVGARLLRQEFNDNDNHALKLELGSFRKGVYNYSIFDSNGRRIASKRFNLVSP